MAAGLLYFAYGSNMLPARLVARCRTASLIGPASLQGWGMAFAKHGMDGSAKATLIRRAGIVQGALFRLDIADLPALDRAEGAGRGYDRHDRLAVRQAGRDVSAVTYIAPHPVHGLLPFDWYLALVLAGARLHGQDPETLDRLRAHPRQADPDRARPGRQAAMAALAAHGFGDPAAVLGRGP